MESVRAGKAMEKERDGFLELAKSDTTASLLHFFFLQERAKITAPEGGNDLASINRVHVIGAGKMGGGIAQWVARMASPWLCPIFPRIIISWSINRLFPAHSGKKTGYSFPSFCQTGNG